MSELLRTDDLESIFGSGRGEIVDLSDATRMLSDVFDRNASALPHPDVVLLSGGIDSILVAVAAVRRGVSPLCVTATTSLDDPNLDGLVAQQVTEFLGLEWMPVLITPREIRDLVTRSMDRLGGAGLYAVGAMVVDLAISDALASRHKKVAWTGGWADILFGPFPSTVDPDGPPRFDSGGRRELIRRACSSDDVNKYAGCPSPLHDIGMDVVQFFETEQCVAAAGRLSPSVLTFSGPDGPVTKAPLRLLGESWGLPRTFTTQPKRALQDSSGAFSLMAESAREDESLLCDDFTVHTPRRHGRDAAIMTAYWLQRMASSSPVMD
jgi:hypothetical protein